MAVHLEQIMLQLLIVALLIEATQTRVIQSMSKPNCTSTCGSVIIPFPFGITKECSLNPSFLITCNQTSRNTHTPFWENDQSVRVLNNSLDGELRVSLPVASDCYDNKNNSEYDNQMDLEFFDLTPFHLSPKRNKLTVVGVHTAGFILPYTQTNNTTSSHGQGHHYTASTCLSLYSDDLVENGSCSGIGCCETTIRQGLSLLYYYTSKKIFNNSYYNNLLRSYPCVHAFLVEDGAYNFNSTHLVKFNNSIPFPVVLDWAVGNHTCQEAMKDTSTYACKSDNSVCHKAKEGPGYLCHCPRGFDGNPYLHDGCHGI